MAIVRGRQNGALLWGASVPAMPLLRSRRTYADVRFTGVAIVNPNAEPATINFYFTDASGNNTGQGSTIIRASVGGGHTDHWWRTRSHGFPNSSSPGWSLPPIHVVQ